MATTDIHCRINMNTYLQLKNQGANISELVRNFLDNYVKQADEPQNVKKVELLKQISNAQKIKEEASNNITMAEIRLQEIETKEKKREKEEYENSIRMNQALKNSGLVEDLI